MHTAKLVHRILFAITLLVGITHAWSVRYQIRPDGVSYIDMARAMSSGDWQTAKNCTWSPGYPAVIAVLLTLTRSATTLGREWVVAHGANLFFYFLALIAFDRFWQEVGFPKDTDDDSIGVVAPVSWTVLGFTLFGITFAPILDVVTPDLCVATVVFATGWFLLRWNRGEPSLRLAAVFGALLGLGYLVKAVLFPLGVAIIGALALAALIRRRGFLGVAVAGLVFLLVASPLIFIVSKASGHLSFSEAGRLVYAWNVNNVTYDENSRIPIGTRALAQPATYLTPIRNGITYAPWYDPSILGKDIKGKMHPAQQARVLYDNYKVVRDTLLIQFGALAFAAILLYWVCRKTSIRQTWPVAFYAICGLGLYSAVLIETRYIGAFVLTFWAACFGSVVIPKDLPLQRFVRMTLAVATAITVFLTLPSLISMLNPRTIPSEPLDVAREVSELGLPQGTKIAVVGDGRWQMWPQPLGLTISAEIPERQAPIFWTDAARQSDALGVMRSAHADVVIGKAPAGFTSPNWQCSSSTGYCVHDLR